MQFSFHFVADPCYHYKNPSVANLNIIDKTPLYGPVLSDGATTNFLWDGITLWELQEQKGQQRVCKHSDVVQPTQVGCMEFILQWKMVKFTGGSALVIVPLVAKTVKGFL